MRLSSTCRGTSRRYRRLPLMLSPRCWTPMQGQPTPLPGWTRWRAGRTGRPGRVTRRHRDDHAPDARLERTRLGGATEPVEQAHLTEQVAGLHERDDGLAAPTAELRPAGRIAGEPSTSAPRLTDHRTTPDGSRWLPFGAGTASASNAPSVSSVQSTISIERPPSPGCRPHRTGSTLAAISSRRQRRSSPGGATAQRIGRFQIAADGWITCGRHHPCANRRSAIRSMKPVAIGTNPPTIFPS